MDGRAVEEQESREGEEGKEERKKERVEVVMRGGVERWRGSGAVFPRWDDGRMVVWMKVHR